MKTNGNRAAAERRTEIEANAIFLTFLANPTISNDSKAKGMKQNKPSSLRNTLVQWIALPLAILGLFKLIEILSPEAKKCIDSGGRYVFFNDRCIYSDERKNP